MPQAPETPQTPQIPEPHDPPAISAVVPTLGRSPWLLACLQALRRQEGVPPVEILVVDQAPQALALPAGLADRVLRPPRNLGFAGGTNLGLAAARGAFVATVNDDAVVAPDWLARLAAALRSDPGAAAAQGVNLVLDHPAATLAGAGAGARAKAGAGTDAGADADAGAGAGSNTGAGDDSQSGHGFDQAEPAAGGAALAGVTRGPGDRTSRNAAETLDGCGLGWNRWWQAIQLGHGQPAASFPLAARGGAPLGRHGLAGRQEQHSDPAPPFAAPPSLPSLQSPASTARIAAPQAPSAFEVFGVSATAALYRREALEGVARDGQVFEPRLISYYEDAELAARLRAAGWRALVVPLARARHAGSASGQAAASRDRWRLIYGNRYLAAARLLGRAFWLHLPAMALRDLLDLRGLVRAVPGGGADRRRRLGGMAEGWWRALRLLPAFAHLGPPVPPPVEVARLSRLPGQPE